MHFRLTSGSRTRIRNPFGIFTVVTFSFVIQTQCALENILIKTTNQAVKRITILEYELFVYMIFNINNICKRWYLKLQFYLTNCLQYTERFKAA